MAPLSLLSLFLSFLCFLSPTLSTDSEGNALLELRSRLSDPTDVFKSWNPAFDACNWFHVTCDSNNHVIRLDLSHSNISGTLGSEVGQLEHLQYLELYMNDIGGKIPKELGKLTNLLGMDLHGNKFEGEIPKSFAKLKSLRSLLLNDNKLTGSIPRELTTLSNLQVFNVSNNDLSGTILVDGPFGSFPEQSFEQNRFNEPDPVVEATELLFFFFCYFCWFFHFLFPFVLILSLPT